MKQMKNGQFSGGKAHGAVSHRLAGDPRRFLAARLPGGTRWDGKEVPMWKRSEVEQLTGLTRHMIQDLCNQNTSGDGLAFWVPAVSKPGYSRFDEGDLFMFYLVKQLSKAGFALIEIESVVQSMLEDGREFQARLQRKQLELAARRRELDAKLRAVATLEDAADAAPEDRPYVMAARALHTGAFRSLAWAARETSADDEMHQAVGNAINYVFPIAIEVMGWDTTGERSRNCAQNDALSAGKDDQTRIRHALDACRIHVSKLAQDCSRFDDASGQRLVQHVVDGFCSLTRSIASPLRLHTPALECLVATTLVHFFSQAENGVPVELACGKGSFAFLKRAACAYKSKVAASVCT